MILWARILSNRYDAVVVGAGFYGIVIAIYLMRSRGLKKVALVERETQILSRASQNNQARIHSGYHYPRSFTTAYRSQENSKRFVSDWKNCLGAEFTHLYAIARRNSKVTSRQFEKFCAAIGSPLNPASAAESGIFEGRLVERVYRVEESVFDALALKDWAVSELSDAGVELFREADAKAIYGVGDSLKKVAVEINRETCEFEADFVFNCTYSGLNQFGGDIDTVRSEVRHQIAEMALFEPSAQISNLGVTLMDGPFFSILPFPIDNLYSLSHVRFTPHFSWDDDEGGNPYDRLKQLQLQSRVERMLRDVRRFIPNVEIGNYVKSLYEIKTILKRNSVDNGRPILFHKHRDVNGCYTVLGGKIDNVFDVLERLDIEDIS